MPWSEFRFVDWMKYWKSSKFFGKVYMFKWKRERFLSLQVFQDCSLDKTLNYQIHWKTMTNFFWGGGVKTRKLSSESVLQYTWALNRLKSW